jgi:hypothetical protein
MESPGWFPPCSGPGAPVIWGLKMTQSFGQKAVGASFNPSGSSEVDKLKGLYAEIIDLLNDIRGSERSERARLASVAITEAQGAQMWAVKAATWKE